MRKLLLLLALFIPASAWAQGVRYDNIAISQRGTPLASQTVTVCTSAGTGAPCTPLASIFPSRTLTSLTIATAGAVRSGGTSTITTTVAPGLMVVGQQVTISGVTDTSFNGTFPIQSVSITSFTYAQVGLSDSTSGSGSVTAPNSFLMDARGNYGFWAAPGIYVVTLTGPQVQTPVVMVVTLAPDLASNIAFTGQILCKNFGNVRCVSAPSGATVSDQGWTGTTADAWISAAIADLPSTGGIVDGRGLLGTQTWAANFWSSVTKPVTLIWDKATFNVSAGITLTPPSNSAMTGGGKQFTSINCSNTGAVDCLSLNSSAVTLRGFKLNGNSIGTGHGIHVTGGGPYPDWSDLRVTAFGGNCIFMDAGSNGIQRLTAYGEIETDHCGGDGWKNLATVNLKAFNVASIQHLESYNNSGIGYHTVGTRSVNGTCNNTVVISLLRVENNVGDGARWENDCDQIIVAMEAEGSTGAGTFGANVDVNSQYISILNLDGAGGTSGSSTTPSTGNQFFAGPAIGTPTFGSPGVNIFNPNPVNGRTGIIPLGTGSRTINLPDASGSAGLFIRVSSASFSPGALAAGTCSTQAATTVTGATTGMIVSVSPVSDPGVGLSWQGILGAGTVSIRLCNTSTGSVTPTATAYNIAVSSG